MLGRHVVLGMIRDNAVPKVGLRGLEITDIEIAQVALGAVVGSGQSTVAHTGVAVRNPFTCCDILRLRK